MKKLLIFLFLVSVFLSKISASPILAQGTCEVISMNSQSSAEWVVFCARCNSRDYGRAALLIDGGVMGAYPDPKDGQEFYITLKRKDLEGKLQGKTSFVAEIKCQYKSGLRWQTDSSCSDSFSLSASSSTLSMVPTGLGSIPTDPGELAAWFLSVATKIAGGVAFLLLVYGGIKFITSGGDPKALDEAKATITSALSGLFLIIFAVLLLKVIGYDILKLPGWGTTPPSGDLILPQ